MVALVDGQPKLLNLREMLVYFLEHRREVVTRRTVFELRKARDRAHILEGLAVALANIDEFIAIIKAAPTPPIAKTDLMAKAWDSGLVREMLSRTESRDLYRPDGLLPDVGLQDSGLYRLSDIQAQEILQMRLQRLTGLEQDKIVQEYKDIMTHIADLIDILSRPERVTAIIDGELTTIEQEFGDARRSQIEMNASDIDIEDLITPCDMVVTLSNTGYIKAQALSEYRTQRRGGRGKQAASTKGEEDWIENLFVANTHDTILSFSNRGRLYWTRVYEVPAGSRTSRGTPIIRMLPLEEGEKITVMLPIDAKNGFAEDKYVFMATSLGTVKKTPLSDFSNPRKAGIIAVNLDEGDYLIGAAITDGAHDVMLFSDAGKAVRFDENDVRPMGRNARGVRGMNLEEGQNIIALLVAESESQYVLTATENGFGKRTPITEYTRHGRGTKGMIAIQTSERNGKVVAAQLVEEDDQIMLITQGGTLVRTRISEVRVVGRATQGVTLIGLDEDDVLSGVQKVMISVDEEDEAEDTVEGNAPVASTETPSDTTPEAPTE